MVVPGRFYSNEHSKEMTVLFFFCFWSNRLGLCIRNVKTLKHLNEGL